MTQLNEIQSVVFPFIISWAYVHTCLDIYMVFTLQYVLFFMEL